MKRIIAIIVVVGLLIGFATFEQVYFHKSINTMEEMSTQLFERVKENEDNVNDPELLAQADRFLAYWDVQKHYYEMLLSHTYTLEMQRNTAVLKIHMEQNDYLMTTTDLASIIEDCELFREVVTPHLHTIL